tara:strand:+ start:629 stop:826 length:198 start_codon:yes stop_codon:yes gene_type:complete
MNRKVTEVLKRFEDENLIKDFQLFCAKEYETIPSREATMNWILKKQQPSSAYKNFLLKWDEQYVG